MTKRILTLGYGLETWGTIASDGKNFSYTGKKDILQGVVDRIRKKQETLTPDQILDVLLQQRRNMSWAREEKT